MSPDSCNLAGYGLYHSGDAGLHWGQPLNRPELDLHLDTGTFPQGFAFSPLDPRIVVVVLASEHNGPLVVRSGDGGSTWRYTLSDPMATADGTTIQNLLPGAVRMALDPTRARVVYLGEASTMDAAGLWLRSTDGGHTWHLLVFPVKLPQDGVTLGADPRLPGLLVARQIDPAIPPDRRYVSADHGGTWRAVACPGDLRGECPSTVLDNVFGAGKAYGFYADGVHAFTGGGAAAGALRPPPLRHEGPAVRVGRAHGGRPGLPALPRAAGSRRGGGAARRIGDHAARGSTGVSTPGRAGSG